MVHYSFIRCKCYISTAGTRYDCSSNATHTGSGFMCWGGLYQLHLSCGLMTGCCKAHCLSGIIKIYTRLFCAIKAAFYLPHIWRGGHGTSIKLDDPLPTSPTSYSSRPLGHLGNIRSWLELTQSHQTFTKREKKIIYQCQRVISFLTSQFHREQCFLWNFKYGQMIC